MSVPGARSLRRAHDLLEAYRWRPPRLHTTSSQQDPPTVHFLTPDVDEPSGGIRTAYRHVDLLLDAGVRATVLHHVAGFRCTWFSNSTPVADVGSARLGPEDLLVVPEIYATLLPLLPVGLRHVILNQSGHLTWDRAPDAVHLHHLTSTDLAAVVTVSDHSRALLQYAYPRLSVERVHHGLDPRLLHPGGERPKRVSFLDRPRGARETAQVLNLLRARGALDGWEVRPLARLAPEALAQELRCSRVFLSAVYQEGFGLPAAEAMACGNLVVGFDGFGGREFLREPFARPVPTGDVLRFAQVVEAVLREEDAAEGTCARAGALASREVLGRYSLERERDDVLRVYGALVGAAVPAR